MEDDTGDGDVRLDGEKQKKLKILPRVLPNEPLSEVADRTSWSATPAQTITARRPK
ncbi:MAG: hypothetical protein WKF43_03835 [Acidimicrobiales bacterium]